ncbi:hypothetical protein N007_12195 [Alicyclobacillus acidoterrestris ATCC 49025]|nr:hypothetical protein N007_12195 [Alicyclobacillus acidoterrestris ATCC 49025]
MVFLLVTVGIYLENRYFSRKAREIEKKLKM